jgi:cobalt-zinc-cadmium efflux system protein
MHHHHHHHHHHGKSCRHGPGEELVDGQLRLDREAHARSESNLRVALFLNLGFALIELVGGIWTGSVAILSDAVHDFGDSLSLGLAWGLQRLAGREADDVFSYGYRRMSLLAALLTCGVLVVGSALVLSEAIPRLFHPQMPNVDGMIGFALLGTAVNGYAAWRTNQGSTLNERVVSWHLIEDVLGWVVVLIGAIAMKFGDWPLLDPILSIFLSLFIFRGVFRSLTATVRLFLQAAPEGVGAGTLTRELETLPGVAAARDLRVWSLDGESHVLTVVLETSPSATQAELEAIKASARAKLRAFGRFEMTIETCPKAGQES